MSVKDAAPLIGVSRSTLYRLIERGEIATCHNGSTYSIKRSALTKYLRDRAREEADNARQKIEQIKASA